MGTLVLPALVVGLIGYLLVGVLGLLPALLVALVAVLILRRATAALTAALEPRSAEDARLLNLVTGLSKDLGREPPRTFIVAGEGVNALVFWYAHGPALGLTQEAASGLPRTELEAIVSHCLVRLDPEAGGLDRAALTLGGTFGVCGWGGTQADDVRAAAVTRYPPALAQAIQRSTPARGRFSYLWFVAEGRDHVPREARIEALGQL